MDLCHVDLIVVTLYNPHFIELSDMRLNTKMFVPFAKTCRQVVGLTWFNLVSCHIATCICMFSNYVSPSLVGTICLKLPVDGEIQGFKHLYTIFKPMNVP